MASSIAYPIRTPEWILSYQGTNITSDISQMAIVITYSDHAGGAASEIEIVLEDHDKLWQGPWYPQQGDIINLLIGYKGEPLLPCGDFQVDEVELEGPPDVFRIRCLSTYITPAMRTRRSAAYEGQTLLQIAKTVAGIHGLAVVSAVSESDVSYSRVTQRNETDLEFLYQLARAQNADFSVRGRQLVFYSRSALEASAPVTTIERRDVLSFGFKNKTHRIYKAAQVSYQQPLTKQLISITTVASPNPVTSDTLKLNVRCENGQQAGLKAAAALHEANMLSTTAWLELPGAPVLSAGNTVVLSGFGVNDGVYMIDIARHRLTRDKGYTAEIEVRRLR